MLRIGLTGGIAAGKSTVAARLAGLGATVVDADRIARDVVAPGTDGFAAVVEAFGPSVVAADGALDRAALGRRVFGDRSALATLESLTHPRIAAATRELLDTAAARGIVVHDVPLLVEKDLGPAYHLVLVVDAPAGTRVQRLQEHRGMTPEDAWSRVRAQATDDERRAAADVLLDTGRDPVDVEGDVDRLWRDRLAPFEGNLVAGCPAPRGPAMLVEPDPGWAEAGRRLVRRLQHVLGDRVDGIEHIGSTAVPGLPAKNVLDVMIGVPDLDRADQLSPVLGAAGFAERSTVRQDTPHPAVDPDPAAWQKRFHRSCDPGRPVNVHVRRTGSPGWRTALLLRDWLRADAEVRAEYAALKLRLAGDGPSELDYAEQKEPWVAAAVPRALAWQRSAATSGRARTAGNGTGGE